MVAWELWGENEDTDIKQGFPHVVVKPHSVKTLRITPIQRDRTTLVGSSFHLTMGAMEASRLDCDALWHAGMAYTLSYLRATIQELRAPA